MNSITLHDLNHSTWSNSITLNEFNSTSHPLKFNPSTQIHLHWSSTRIQSLDMNSITLHNLNHSTRSQSLYTNSITLTPPVACLNSVAHTNSTSNSNSIPLHKLNHSTPSQSLYTNSTLLVLDLNSTTVYEFRSRNLSAPIQSQTWKS